MPRKYKYTDFKTNRVLLETTQENHVSDDEVNAMFKKKTGRDFRLEKAVIQLEIRMVKE